MTDNKTQKEKAEQKQADEKSCKDCDRYEACMGNDSGIFPCPDFIDKEAEIARLTEALREKIEDVIPTILHQNDTSKAEVEKWKIESEACSNDAMGEIDLCDKAVERLAKEHKNVGELLNELIGVEAEKDTLKAEVERLKVETMEIMIEYTNTLKMNNDALKDWISKYATLKAENETFRARALKKRQTSQENVDYYNDKRKGKV